MTKLETCIQLVKLVGGLVIIYLLWRILESL